MALKVVNYLDTAWEFEIGTLGFREPVLPDQGCGPDGKFDVFIWRGHENCWVNAIDPNENKGVSCKPVMTYMLLDPWGKYGGDILRQTIGHEFNHASHAPLDWNETLIALEMTATYVEQYFWDAYPRSASNFQGNPDRSLLWVNEDEVDSNSSTWLYMYGSALYMRFLRDRYFPDDERFAARLWDMLPNHDCSRNSPNIWDGLNRLLGEASPPSSFLASAIAFARWRYYTGSRDDGRHFLTWSMPFAQFPFIPESTIALDGDPLMLASTGTMRYQVKKAPMILGSSFIEIRPVAPDQTAFEVELIPSLSAQSVGSPNCPQASDLEWVVQAVPGAKEGEDGEFVDLRHGPGRLDFVKDKDGPMRTLIITLLPTGTFDPDHQCQAVFPFALSLRSL